jgi:hypothetical protein
MITNNTIGNDPNWSTKMPIVSVKKHLAFQIGRNNWGVRPVCNRKTHRLYLANVLDTIMQIQAMNSIHIYEQHCHWLAFMEYCRVP